MEPKAIIKENSGSALKVVLLIKNKPVVKTGFFHDKGRFFTFTLDKHSIVGKRFFYSDIIKISTL